MLTEAVGQPESQQCQMSLGLSATPLHDFSQSMVLLQNRPNKWPNEPRVGPQVAEMFKELHAFHDSRLVYPEDFEWDGLPTDREDGYLNGGLPPTWSMRNSLCMQEPPTRLYVQSRGKDRNGRPITASTTP